MAGLSYTVRIERDDLSRALQDAVDKLQDREGFHRVVGEHLLTSVDERFETQTAPDGSAWQSLSPKTVAKRIRDDGFAPVTILRQSGRLAGSISYEANAERTKVGTPVVYAAIHQFGGQAGRNLKVTIPARPYLGLSDDDETEIVAIAQDWLEN